jgi:hypothetical protein
VSWEERWGGCGKAAPCLQGQSLAPRPALPRASRRWSRRSRPRPRRLPRVSLPLGREPAVRFR